MNNAVYCEEDLIERSRSGDENAFCVLVGQYQRLLFGTAYLILKDSPAAEEAVQETIIKMWKHLSSLRDYSSIRAWLLRIVVNESKQQLRKKKFITVPLDEAAEIAELDDTDELMIHNEDHHELVKALALLSPEQKEVIILRYFTELTVPEIAKVTDTHEGTIKSRLSRALDRLHEILSGGEENLGREAI
ncbi:MAG: RNA polymerase sigma factor [Dehalococcoidales bacterium]|jgi:RNA polymerase sigma-70 factor (ECF subfamily)